MSDPIDAAVAALARGELVAFPTETVYGLGADATNPAAVRRLYAVKGRPAGHPVIAHLGRDAELDRWVTHVPPAAARLAAACWPGPLTLVLTKRPGGIVDEATGGRPTVGLRVPDHSLALDLLDAFARPVAAPSANRFGRVSPTTAQHVRDDLGDDVAVVLDGGPCRVGVESTIVDCSGAVPAVLRVGGVSVERVRELVGDHVALRTSGEVAAPGTLAAHYAPTARVVVLDIAPERAADLPETPGRAGLLGLGLDANAFPGVVVLPVPATADEYAQVLYQRLRDADAQGIDTLFVVRAPDEGIGAAVNDRVRRAAATVRP